MFEPERVELMIFMLSICGGLFIVFSVWITSLLGELAKQKASKSTCWKNLDAVKEQSEKSMKRLRELTKKLDP